MQAITAQTIESLKAEGHYFAAGAVAHALTYTANSYGCHYGMRSDADRARREYAAGWEAAERHMRAKA